MSDAGEQRWTVVENYLGTNWSAILCDGREICRNLANFHAETLKEQHNAALSKLEAERDALKRVMQEISEMVYEAVHETHDTTTLPNHVQAVIDAALTASDPKPKIFPALRELIEDRALLDWADENINQLDAGLMTFRDAIRLAMREALRLKKSL